MGTHLKVLAWINLCFGGMGLLLGLAVMAGASLLSGFVEFASQDVSLPAPVIQIAGGVILGVIVLLSLPCLFLGYGLLNLRPWARILGIVLAALNLLNVPLGTVLSLYAFWILLKPETEALFRTGSTSPVCGSL